MKIIAFLVCLFCFFTHVDANDSAVYGVGGNIQPMDNHKSIRMVSEKIDIDLYPDYAKVRCEFIFKNEGKATTVKMGFPESGFGDISTPTKSSFRYFRSYVDGKAVSTQYIPAKKFNGNNNDYQAWYVKQVKFNAGQVCKIVDEYESILGGSSDGSRFLTYVLKTGKSWKGKINKAVISVDVSRLAYRYRFQCIEPKGYKKSSSKITWLIKDFEPKENVFINFMQVPSTINGMEIYKVQSNHQIKNGTVMMDVDVLGQSQSGIANITVNTNQRHCTIKYGKTTLRLTSGSKKAVLNGSTQVLLPVAPISKWEDRLFMVPIAAIVRALGGTAVYDNKTKALHMTLADKNKS